MASKECCPAHYVKNSYYYVPVKIDGKEVWLTVRVGSVLDKVLQMYKDIHKNGYDNQPQKVSN